MKTNIGLFWILAVFFVLADVAYTAWSLIDHGSVEWTGTLGIGLAGVLSAFIAFYVNLSYKAQGGELPEDRLDAAIDDGEPEQGFFSPWSWWPLALASGAAVCFLALAVGIWLFFIGIAFTVIALVGWTYEYQRGNFGH